MKGPERMTEGGASPFEAELLRSWQIEQPSARVRQRVLAMGAGGAAVVAASTSAQAAGAVGSKLGAGLVIKWFGAGIVAGLATSVVSVSVLGPPAPAPPAQAQAQAAAPVANRPSVAAPGPLAPAVDTSASPALAPPTSVAPRREVALPVSATAHDEAPRPTPLGALAPQVALLDRARNALRSGDTTRALGLVAEYQRTYPNGVLSQEAEVLGIDILERQGQRGEAKRRAQRFLNSHPTSAHADRLRRLAGDGSNP